MHSKPDIKIAIIGAGNVATRLGLAMKERGLDIVGVASRGGESARILASKLGCAAYSSASQIPPEASFILIATQDHAVADAVAQLPESGAVVAHTSGSVPLDVVAAKFARAGVLYPLQTFSRDVDVNVAEVPFFTEATDGETLAIIDALASSLSFTVHHADSRLRSRLHVAGVLTSNFPIWLLKITEDLLSGEGLPLSTVAPLMKATIEKAFEVGPESAMTGPARRGDRATIAKHMQILAGDDREIYRLLSEAILNHYHPENEQNPLPPGEN